VKRETDRSTPSGDFFANSASSAEQSLVEVTFEGGISFWGGVLWRRANRYGAWASIVAGGIVLLVTSEYTLVNQIAWYLSAGIGSLVVVSLLTRPESKEMLDRFYTVLYTPVGQEHKLREAGISVVLE